MSLCGFGQIGDIRCTTICLRGKIIVDEDRNFSGAQGKFNDVRVRNNAVVCGDLKVKGNILGNIAGGSSGYSASFFINQPMSTLDALTRGSFAFTIPSAPLNIAGHLYSGPVGVPLCVTILFSEDIGTGSATPDSNIFIEELDLAAFNFPPSGNINTISVGFGTKSLDLSETKDIEEESEETPSKSRAPFIPSSSAKSTTVVPTMTNSYWHYYCTPIGAVEQSVQSITITEL